MEKKNIYIMLIVLAVILFAGCGSKAADAEKNIENKERAPVYETVEINIEEIYEEIEQLGIVKAFREIQISPETSGKIIKINCETGDKVSMGDVLVELDDEEKTITLKKKKALLKKAEATTKKVDRDTKKADSLFKDGVISDSEYDGSSLNSTISMADLELAAAEVQSAEKALRDTKLAAPFNGKIAAKEAEAGDIAEIGQSLLTLIDISQVKIKMDISEFDAAKIKPRNETFITIDSLPDKTFKGKVYTIGLKADDSTRTYPVEIVVLNPQENILPGMVARATIKSSIPRKVIVISKSVVQTAGIRSTVQLMQKNKIIQRTIEIEKQLDDNRVVVSSGLKDGDVIVVGIDETGSKEPRIQGGE